MTLVAAAAAPPPLPPPVLSAPAPREISFGRVAGRAAPGVERIVVRADGRVLARREVRGPSFDFAVALPRRDVTVRVTAIDGRGRGATVTVDHVFGLPRAARPRGVTSRDHQGLASRMRALARAFPGTSAVYVQDLTTGRGAAWNARARFPAASTLKVAIAVEALRTLRGKPPDGSSADRLLRAMLVYSDNGAANALEVLFGGSTSGGSARVNALMRSLGLRDSEMYGGYERSPAARRPIPLRADSQPAFGRGKHTTAFDLARLLTLVHLAAEGKGRLAELHRGSFTPSEARYLLYLLAHVADHGKLDRFLPASAGVLHKGGWLAYARHDAGLVYWAGGVYVAAVMTYGRVGAGSDVLAGRVALAALSTFSRTRAPAGIEPPEITSSLAAENAKAGTSAWQGAILHAPAIEAYASEISVRPGETVRFHVSTDPAAPYEIRVYRLGWYGGLGGRLQAVLANRGEPRPGTADAQGAGWPVTDTLTVPEGWISGYYLARFVLVGGPYAGRSASTVVVVRAHSGRRARILVQVPVNTWQAYNSWGGKSLYDFNSEGGRAARVSFERPYRLGAARAFDWELPLVRFLESEGHDISYQTDVDTHREPASLLGHRLVIVAGHSEYWTSRMRDAFEAARDQGTNLAFMGANIGFWQVRYEDGGRTLVGYKSSDDPVADPALRTVQFRDLTPPRSECPLLGVQWEKGLLPAGEPPRPYTVAAPDDPWFAGTGFTRSTVLPGLVGPEWDAQSCPLPGLTVLFHYEGRPSDADAVRYTAPSGARVFSAGSLLLSSLLDDHPADGAGPPSFAAAGLQRFMRNALDDLARPARPRALEVRVTGSGDVAVRVEGPPDPRVRAAAVFRDGVLVCSDAAPACVDRDAPGHRRHTYSAASVDAWGTSLPLAATPVRVPNRSPSVALDGPRSLPAGARAVYAAAATDRDGDALTLSWRIDGRPVARRGSRLPVRFRRPGRHVIELEARDRYGGRSLARVTVLVGG